MAPELCGPVGLSENEFKKELYNSLVSTGTLDLLKSQLRAKLMDQLRNARSVDNPGSKRDWSLLERLLSSLFVDYLQSKGYSFTLSVFLPESQMGNWPAFSHQEMLQLLRLDTASIFCRQLEQVSGDSYCLAQKLVMGLQKMSFKINFQDATTQTSDISENKNNVQLTTSRGGADRIGLVTR